MTDNPTALTELRASRPAAYRDTDAVTVRRDLMRAALSFAACGWHVFPCAIGGKQPALHDNWLHIATTDPARIRRWWSRLSYNIGISCGPSGLVILDLDIPGHGVHAPAGAPASNSADALVGLCREQGQPLPFGTFTASTPSGGFHLYFSAPSVRVRNSAGKLAALIDVRAAGGYVIGPGSRVGARPYIITNPAPPAPLPPWITKLTESPGPQPAPTEGHPGSAEDASAWAATALRGEVSHVAGAPQCTRNDTLNRAAFRLGQLVGAHLLSARAVMHALEQAAVRAGLPEAEAQRTIGSGMAAGTRNPRRIRAADADRHLRRGYLDDDHLHHELDTGRRAGGWCGIGAVWRLTAQVGFRRDLLVVPGAASPFPARR